MKDIYSPLEIDEEWDQRAPQFGGPDNAASVAVAGEASAPPAEVGVADGGNAQAAEFGDAKPLEINTPHAEVPSEPATQPEVAVDQSDPQPVGVEADLPAETAPDTVSTPPELHVDAEPEPVVSETPPTEAPVAEAPATLGDVPEAASTDLPAPPAPDTTFQPQAKPEGVVEPETVDPEPVTEHVDVVGDEKGELADAEAAADGKEDAETGDLPVSPVDSTEDSQLAEVTEPEAPAVTKPEPAEADTAEEAAEPSAEFSADERNPLEEALNNYRAGLEKEKKDLEDARGEVAEQLEAAKKREAEAQAALEQAKTDVKEAEDGQTQIDGLITNIDGLLETKKKAA